MNDSGGPRGRPLRIAVLVTCYNRAATTIAALDALFEQGRRCECAALDVHVVDDASPDGTGGRIVERFPSVQVIQGTGDLYWNRGMHLALDTALRTREHDAYLFFNDDIRMIDGALERFLRCFKNLMQVHEELALVGAVRDERQGATIYTALRRRSGRNPCSFRPLEPEDKAIPCDTGNGNFVLFSRAAMTRLGNLDPRFRHAIGDIDILLRARRLGMAVFLAPGHVAEGERNPLLEKTLAGKSLTQRAAHFFGPKGDPYGFGIFFIRHGGLIGAAYYVAFLLNSLLGVIMPRTYYSRRRVSPSSEAA